MLRLSILLSFLYAIPLHAANYVVAPQGNDSNPGTLAQPFASIKKAQEVVAPGDTVYLRGGTYLMKEAHIMARERNRAIVIHLFKSGLQGRPIRYMAYQQEQPIFDFSEVTPERMRVHAIKVSGSWLHLSGITTVGVQVTIKEHTQSINIENSGSNNLFEKLTMRDGQGIGFWLGRGSNNLILNCDAYNNHDHTSENKRGGNVDGFGFHVPQGSVNNVFRGCRAWYNSDDGFDSISTSEAHRLENCWAFYNGTNKSSERLGDGNGFKVGGYASTPVDRLPKTIPRHVVIGCIAALNRASGFYSNHQIGGIDFLGNSSYRNSRNFNMLGRSKDHTGDVPGYDHVIKNNASFGSRHDIDNVDRNRCEISNNSFDLKIPLTQEDFISLDETELMKPRQANGDLPVIRFMQLPRSSALIDRGADIGRKYYGKKPDIGALEHKP